MLCKTCQYFCKPYERSCGNKNVELDLSNYARKAKLKLPKVLIQPIKLKN